jgi:hypothetical protein
MTTALGSHPRSLHSTSENTAVSWTPDSWTIRVWMCCSCGAVLVPAVAFG